jgi:RimJ/RimL family protein N-acetyltransferase
MITLRAGDVDAFVRVPTQIYGPEVGHVAPMRRDVERMLDPVVNPLWRAGNPFAFWTAHRDGRPVGRIIAHVHRASNTRHAITRAQFGFFDCADDPDAAAALLEAAADFGRAHGQTELAGNFNLTAMQQIGVVTGGFGVQAYTDMVVGPAYLPALLEGQGFERFFPMTTFEIDLDQVRLPVTTPDVGSIGFAPIRPRDFPARMEEARQVLNDGFWDNPMFVPLTADEFAFQAGELSAILDPRLSAVLHEDGRPTGVVICIPDLNGLLSATRGEIGLMAPWHYLRFRMRRRRAVIIFYSVVRQRHGRGLMGAMLARTVEALRAAGYRSLGVTWIADSNAASLRQMQRLGARPLQRLHLFRKAIA